MTQTKVGKFIGLNQRNTALNAALGRMGIKLENVRSVTIELRHDDAAYVIIETLLDDEAALAEALDVMAPLLVDVTSAENEYRNYELGDGCNKAEAAQ